MTGRLKLLAAALGLVLATGTFADAQTSQPKAPAPMSRTHTAPKATTLKATALKASTPRIAATRLSHRMHRLHVAHRAIFKAHVARHTGTVVKVATLKPSRVSVKEARAINAHRERHAMNHRGTTKPVSVVR